MRDPNAQAKDLAEAEIIRLLEEEFDGQLDEILELLGDPPDLTKIPLEFWSSLTASMAAKVRPALEKAALAAAKRLVLDPGIGVDWSLVAEDAARWASEYSYNLVTGLMDTTRSVLQEKVTQFLREPGRTIGDLTKDLLEAGFSETRAQMIAVTETTRAFAEGEKLAVAQAQEYGFRMVAIWHTNRDELVCPICAPADGKPEPEWGMATGPPAHPRCRCWVTHRSVA